MRQKNRSICKEEDCDKPAKIKGFCKSHYQKEWRTKNIEHLKEYHSEYQKEYRTKNIEHLKEYIKEYRTKNIEHLKEYQKEYSKEYFKNNMQQFAARNAARRARKRYATPSWSDLKKIREIYENCPIGYHVDHIVPLPSKSNKNISGLHVPWNLQYLTQSENASKNCKFDGTYENELWRKDIKINE